MDNTAEEREIDNLAVLVVYTLLEETSSSESDSSHSENDNLLLHASAALIDRRPIPNIGSFYDIITNYDDQEFRRHFSVHDEKLSELVLMHIFFIIS
jgi:hypothetical protein